MTDKAKPFPPHASMSTPELIARLRSCTTSIFGEWEAADRLASVPVLEARVAELRLMLECVEQQLDYGQIDTAKKLVQAALALAPSPDKLEEETSQ